MAERNMTEDQLKALISDVVGKQVADMVNERSGEFKNYAQGLRSGVADAAPVEPRKQSDPDQVRNFGMFVRALAANHGDVERAASWAAKTYGDSGATVSKALAASDAVAGGVLVPEVMSSEVIEFIRPASVFRSAGPVTIQMDGGNLSIPRIDAGASASYIGENQALPVTSEQFGEVRLSFKKLGALVALSNDLLRQNSYGADELVRNDVALAMAQREDLAFIRNLGTQYTPRGLRYWAQSSNVFATAGTSLANMITDLSTAILKLDNANISFIRPCWLMSPRTKMSLMTVTNAQGFYVFRAEMQQGTLWGFPFKKTTQIPTNLGSGSDSELYLADFAHIVIGETRNLIIEASNQAAYYDGSQVQSAWSNDQTSIRAIQEHDMVMRHQFAAAVVTGVDY